MYLKRLHLKNFRNHLDLNLHFGPKLNVITGDNGIGKTNILEAIYLISTGKSFRTAFLEELIAHSCSFFYIEAEFVKENIHQTIKIGYEKKRKQIEYNASKLTNFTHLLGIIPSVLFAPKDISLVTGAPAERRRFLNIYLSQLDPLYVHYLQRYTHCLEHRNALLKAKKPFNLLEMRCFEKELSIAALYLINKRIEGVQFLQEKLSSHSASLTDKQERFEMRYQSQFSSKASLSIDSITAEYEKLRDKEKILGSTLLGPHREDLNIFLHQQCIKSFCSEGQKRSFLTALKFAEWDVLAQAHQIQPIMCLDDLGVHLDEKRLVLLENKLASLEQVFITTPKNQLSSACHGLTKTFELRSELQLL